MPPSCPMTGGGFRGPPVPLLLVPIIVQLVRSSCDPKMTAYLKQVGQGGPKSIAENAHKIAQYALSKVPSSVLYWFASKVLALPPETAMQTTEFLKSRNDVDILLVEDTTVLQIKSASDKACGSSLHIERRLEKLELEYQLLQKHHAKPIKLLTYESDDLEIPRELPLPEISSEQNIETATNGESTQILQLHSSPQFSQNSSGETEANAALQDVGLRLGRIFLEWAGDTMKQSLVTAASKSSANSALVGAGVDLASRLVDAVVT
ncbi:unnamed protein product [Discula destructiva]